MMNILDIFEIAAILGKLEKCFTQELTIDDFFALPAESYASLAADERAENWFTINPQKLTPKMRMESSLYIVSGKQQTLILKAFDILKNYSPDLPEDAHFKERLLVAKTQLPSVIFEQDEEDDYNKKTAPLIQETKLIPFKKKET